jgi:hypothetical protein
VVARRPLRRTLAVARCIGGCCRPGQDKEKQFIDKMKAAGKADVEAQLKRLSVPRTLKTKPYLGPLKQPYPVLL